MAEQADIANTKSMRKSEIIFFIRYPDFRIARLYTRVEGIQDSLMYKIVGFGNHLRSRLSSFILLYLCYNEVIFNKESDLCRVFHEVGPFLNRHGAWPSKIRTCLNPHSMH
jgi:hypothetical protein